MTKKSYIFFIIGAIFLFGGTYLYFNAFSAIPLVLPIISTFLFIIGMFYGIKGFRTGDKVVNFIPILLNGVLLIPIIYMVLLVILFILSGGNY